MTALVARLLSASVGVWLMAAPALLGFSGPTRIAHLILGPIVVAAAVVAIWPATNMVRWVGMPIALVLVIVALLYEPGAGGRMTGLVGAVLVGLLAVPGGNPAKALGGGWRSLWTDEPVEQEATQ